MSRAVLWIERIRKTGSGNYGAPQSSVEYLNMRTRPFTYVVIAPDMVDYSRMNGAGSRGIYAGYMLDDECVYRVSAPQSWNRSDLYHCVVEGSKIKRLEAKQVLEWARKG